MASQKSRFSIFPVLKGLRKIDWLFPCFYKRKDISFKIPTYRSSCPEVFSRVNNCLKISGNFTGKQTWWRPFLGELSCSLYQNKSLWTDFAPPSLERFFLILKRISNKLSNGMQVDRRSPCGSQVIDVWNLCNYWDLKSQDFQIFPLLKELRKIDWLFLCFYKRKDISFKISTCSCPEVFSRITV